MISPTQSFSEGYDATLVEFTLRPGTMTSLEEAGVRDDSALTAAVCPDVPSRYSGWSKAAAYFKGEGDQINIGLGRGPALDIFNAGIVDFSEIRR